MIFTVDTVASTRWAKRRNRTTVVEADTAEEAIADATGAHMAAVRWAADVIVTRLLVDGRPPVHCPHDDARRVDGFVLRADGSRLCHPCAELEAAA